jgi:hypothetical protein
MNEQDRGTSCGLEPGFQDVRTEPVDVSDESGPHSSRQYVASVWCQFRLRGRSSRRQRHGSPGRARGAGGESSHELTAGECVGGHAYLLLGKTAEHVGLCCSPVTVIRGIIPRRSIPPRGVPRRSNMPSILSRRAFPAGRRARDLCNESLTRNTRTSIASPPPRPR